MVCIHTQIVPSESVGLASFEVCSQAAGRAGAAGVTPFQISAMVGIAECWGVKPAPTKRDRRAHSKQHARVQCLRDSRRYSFLPRTIPDLNDLLTEAVAGAMSLDVFMSGARKLHQ